MSVSAPDHVGERKKGGSPRGTALPQDLTSVVLDLVVTDVRADAHRRGVRDLGRLALTAEGEAGVLALVAFFPGPALDVDQDDLAGLDLAEEDLLRQLVLDLALDGPAQRPGTEH